jgi:hypothetical protein
MASKRKKDPAAVSLGRRGGLKGGKKGGTARMALLTPEERSALARKAVLARWRKYKAARKNKPKS